jgi:hypothetical protein
MTWYEDAREAIDAIRLRVAPEVTLDVAVGMAAALSVNQSWKGNLTLLARHLAGAHVGLRVAERNCTRARQGKPLLGPKVEAFRRAILGDTEAVVIDRWTCRALGVKPPKAWPQGRYEALCEGIRKRARRVGMAPRDYQAALWVAERGAAL